MLTASISAFSQGDDDIFTLSLEQLLQVKVTGSTLTEENIKTVPASVSVFTSQQIDTLGLDTLDELMNLVPGFQSYRSSFSSMLYPFSARGRRIALPSAEILVLIDGQRQNEPRTSGSAVIIPKFPLALVERVEFIRGPGAAIYGSNAMMAVINIITHENKNELAMSYGSFNRKKMNVLSSGNLWGVQVQLLAHIDDDNGQAYNLADTFSLSRIATSDPRQSRYLYLKTQWQQFKFNVQLSQYKSKDFYEANGLSPDFNKRKGQLLSANMQYDFAWQSVTSKLWFGVSQSNLEFYAQLTPANFFSENTLPTSDPPSNEALFSSPNFSDYTETRFLWHNNWRITNQQSLQFGIELRHIDAPESVLSSNFNLGELATKTFPVTYYGSLQPKTIVQEGSSRSIRGLYGQYQWKILTKTQLTIGLRYDEFSQIAAQFSPKIALVHNINAHQSIKFLYGKAFRAPAESELHLQNNIRFLGNNELVSETVDSFELVWLGQWSKYYFSVNYFKNHFKDAIGQIITPTGQLQYTNFGHDHIDGFEFEVSHQMTKELLIQGSYTLLKEVSELSFREADKLASVVVNYNIGYLNINLSANYAGARQSPILGGQNLRITLDDYWQFFAKVSYKISSNWQLYLQGKNLLNTNIETPATNPLLREGTANRGRELLFGVTWQY